MFFKIIDTDGNGQLSFDEVFEICEMSLGNCFSKTDENDQFIKTLSEFFTTVIFRQTKRELDDEIPLPEIW